MMALKLKYLAVLFLVSFQSCSMCSSKKVDTSMVSDDSESVVEGEYRESWSSLPNIGYPVISDSIPSLLLERYCYSVSYNKFTRQPNWVMWQLTGEHMMPKKACDETKRWCVERIQGRHRIAIGDSLNFERLCIIWV